MEKGREFYWSRILLGIEVFDSFILFLVVVDF